MLKKWFSLAFLLVIMAVAIFLRFGGINHGYPPYHPDEGMSYAQGISIIKEGTLDADGYSLALAYPNVIPLVNALLFKVLFIPAGWLGYYLTHLSQIADGLVSLAPSQEEFQKIFQLNILGEREIKVLIWGRIIVASFGVGVVGLIYLMSKKMFGVAVGLAAAALVAVNFRQVLNSHLDLPDVYNAFFLILSMIFSYRLIGSARKIDYLLAGIFVGISIATKLHVYAVFPFIVACLISAVENKRSIKEVLFDAKPYISALAAILIAVLIDPIHLVKVEETISELTYVSMKYGVNRFRINLYPFWYLFNIGIGKLTSVLIIPGMLAMLLRKPKHFVFIFSAVITFFFVVTYATNGGFYTRNFVTITPLLLIFPAYLLGCLLMFKDRLLKVVAIFVFTAILSLALWENLSNSVIIPIEYSKQWNYLIAADWISKNIPAKSKVAAHSSVPLPVDGVIRLPFEQGQTFSVQEFIGEGAEYAVANFDWATNDFYDWMNRPKLTDWGKPNAQLESQYSAMAIRELSDFTVYSVIKPWQAPDSDFLVSKIPNYTATDKKLIGSYFDIKSGWRAAPIKTEDLDGLAVDGELSNGYLYVNFYKDEGDLSDVTKRIAVRVSGRNMDEKAKPEKIITQIPQGTAWAVVGFSSYSASNPVAKQILIYNIKVNADFGGVPVYSLKIDDGIIFPNSHGNL